MADKVYYTTQSFSQEPLEFFDDKDQAELYNMYHDLTVRECTTAKALNLL